MADDLKELRDLFGADRKEWDPIRDEGALDMRYVAGDPWAPKDRRDREKAGRPCLALDELGQYYNQVINDVRANPRAVKFSATGNGANDEGARFYGNKAREIEYRSNAQIAYTSAFENAVMRGYGWCRVNLGWKGDRSFDRELEIAPIVNPDMVLPDPEAQRPDSSDMKHCWVYETWRPEELTAKFGQKVTTDLQTYLHDAPLFVRDKSIVLAEYWRITTRPRTLLQVMRPAPPPVDGQQPQAVPEEVFEDELVQDGQKKPMLPRGVTVLQTRRVDYPQVVMQLTNGLEILEETPWRGRYIPIISCFGKVLYLDEGAGAKRKILSMTRLARDPYMLYCYYRTAEAEMVGMTPKFPYFYYEGSLRPREMELLQKSIHQPVAAIAVKPTLEGAGQTMAPFPQRQPYEPPIAALEIGAEAARRAIMSAMGGAPLPTQAQRKNEKSGIALQQIEASSQKGTFHFVDHYNDMITQVGVILEDLIDKVYDTAQDVGVIEADDTAAIVRVNDPAAVDPQGQPAPLETKGDYQVTISTGPSFESQRERASEFADMIAGNPQIFSLIGPLIVKLKNLGPIGDEISEALEVLQPPELRKKKDGEDQMSPEEAQAMLQQAQEIIQGLGQQVEEMQRALETEAVKQQGETARDQIEQQTRVALERMKGELAAALQQLKGDQAVELQQVKGHQEGADREDRQRHEMALAAAAADGRLSGGEAA